ncbi:MAG: hypothetical protein U0744_05150, partial [Gemmataceae bacterium]
RLDEPKIDSANAIAMRERHQNKVNPPSALLRSKSTIGERKDIHEDAQRCQEGLFAIHARGCILNMRH